MSLQSVSRSMRIVSSLRVSDARCIWHYGPNDTVTVVAVDFGANLATLSCNGIDRHCQLPLDSLLRAAVPLHD